VIFVQAFYVQIAAVNALAAIQCFAVKSNRGEVYGLKQSSKTALGGIVAALSISLMFIVSVIPLFTYALPAAVAILIVPVIIEINKKWALGVYAAVSILAVILVPNKEVAVIYAAFFGYYPIIKAIIEKRLPKVFGWLVKIIIFNSTMFISYYLMLKFMGIKIDELESLGVYAIPILLSMGSVAFVLYDYALSKIISIYIVKWQSRFRKLFK
jgi:hypothetical protein